MMTMTRRRIIWLVVLVAALLVVGEMYYMMRAPHRDISHEKPIVTTSVELVKSYQDNETAANRHFLDKAVQVTGVIEGVENDSDGKVVVTLASGNPLSGVRCTLQTGTIMEIGKTVTLKGRCTGYLSDVVLVDCLLIE